jgi:hypothetical protein
VDHPQAGFSDSIGQLYDVVNCEMWARGSFQRLHVYALLLWNASTSETPSSTIVAHASVLDEWTAPQTNMPA